MTQFRKKSWHQQVKELTQQNQELFKELNETLTKAKILLYLYQNSVRVNKKNLEYFKERCRLLEDNYVSLEELEDK